MSLFTPLIQRLQLGSPTVWAQTPPTATRSSLLFSPSSVSVTPSDTVQVGMTERVQQRRTMRHLQLD